jgi:predicted HD superfamily hydrolase involved in NAD metabolism
VTALEEAQALVAERLSPKLLGHSQRVAETAAELAVRWGADPDEARLAGLLHDYCRALSAEEALAQAEAAGLEIGPLERGRPLQLLHARLAAAQLAGRGFGPACLRAVATHTMGGPGMDTLQKCVYLADAIEPGRRYPGVEELRSLAANSLDDALRSLVRLTIVDLVERRRPVHPSTIALYNELHG